MSTAYIDLLDELPLEPAKLVSFRFPAEAQHRLSDLLDRNRAGSLSSEEHEELQRFVAAEAVIRVLKAKALLALKPQA
ncbi:MAG TPA: hypothetical protein VEJ63_15675 [Planctomycetota bacterium]|nr:hypothetical protein [Planctomycetota bacterium]